MGIIKDNDKKALSELLAKGMVNPVRLVMFTQRSSEEMGLVHACHFCQDTETMLNEIAALSDKVKVEAYDLVADRGKADEYRLDKIPAIAIVGARDYGVRYFGMPTGFEFNTFVQDIVDVSRGTTDLSPATKEKVRSLKNYVHIQVFTTPTCPYCPAVVRMAHKMAIESDRILADMVDAMEFMQLVERYHVHGTPRVVINDSTSFEGVVPETGFLAFVFKAAGEISEEEFAKELAKFHHH